jgi:membrane protein DedA with SNARE-associated domain
MENGVFSGLMSMVQSHPGWLIAMAFAFALLESLAIVGIFVPGIVLLFIIGAVIGMDLNLFVACWLAAMAGALAGDGISYWLGARFSDQVPRVWPLSRRPDMLAAGQAMFARHGGKGVFIGRFIGPIRPVVPLISGMMGMRPATFLLFAAPACLLWAPLYLLPGMLFGASLELAAEFAGRLAVVLLILVLGTWFVVWLTRVIYGFTARRSGWWLKSLIRWSSDHPVLGRPVGALFEPGGREVISVALLGLLLLISLAVLLAVLVVVPFADPAWDAERQLAGWAASLRNHFADPLFVALSLAGSLRVMALLAAAMTLLLIALNRFNAAWHWLAATAGGWLLAELLHGTTSLMLVQPDFMPSLGEVPHRAFALTTVVLGFFAVMLAKDLSARRRKWPYLFASGLLGLIGFANFYLGQASVSGLLSALALGMGWVALIGIGYRQRALARRRPVGLALMFYALLLGIAVVQVQSNHEVLMEGTRLAQPERSIERDHWQETGWQELPDRLTRLGRYDRARFDFQVAADLMSFEQRLMDAGWESVAEAELKDFWSVLLAQPTIEGLPHLSKDFAGRPDQLVLRKVGDDETVVVLRVWASGAKTSPDELPIWLGQVRQVQPAAFLNALNRWLEIDAGRADAAAWLNQSLQGWWQRQASPSLWLYSAPDSDSITASNASSL